jgi:hypothetical protein
MSQKKLLFYVYVVAFYQEYRKIYFESNKPSCKSLLQTSSKEYSKTYETFNSSEKLLFCLGPSLDPPQTFVSNDKRKWQ